jgi:cytochrome P450
MQFGYGRHSCPGRGFTTLLLKSFLATLLHEFDVELLDGAEFPKQVDRGTTSMPPMDVKLRFRKRKVDVPREQNVRKKDSGRKR